MIIWKALVGQCLQCVKEPTNQLNMNVPALVRTNSHCKEDVVRLVQQKSPWLCLCLYSSLTALQTSLQLWNTSTMEEDTDWKSQWIFIFNFQFSIKLAKKWSNTENLNETVKHWKQSENKYLKMSYMACYWVCLLMGG